MNCKRTYYVFLKCVLMRSCLRKIKNSEKWIHSLSQKEGKDSLDFLEGFAFDNIQLLYD